jgi:hypothetical protein
LTQHAQSERQFLLLTSAQRTPLQSATADVVAQPLGARMVLSTNTARSLSLLAPWSVNSSHVPTSIADTGKAPQSCCGASFGRGERI